MHEQEVHHNNTLSKPALIDHSSESQISLKSDSSLIYGKIAILVNKAVQIRLIVPQKLRKNRSVH